MEELLKKVQSCQDVLGAIAILGSQIPLSIEIDKAVAFTVEKHTGQLRKSNRFVNLNT